MKLPDKKTLLLRSIESAYSLLILVTFLISLISKQVSWINLVTLPFDLFGAPGAGKVAFIITCVIVYAVPLIALFKLSSWFTESLIPDFALPNRLPSIALSFLQSSFVIASYILFAFTFFRNAHALGEISIICMAILILSVAINALSLVLFFKNMNRRDEGYQEYVKYRETLYAHGKKLEVMMHPGIQRRLFFSFVPLIVSVIIILSLILMRSFYLTIHDSVVMNGKALAERTANIIKANPADQIAAEDYLLIESKKNQSSEMPFMDISYYARTNKAQAAAPQPKVDSGKPALSKDATAKTTKAATKGSGKSASPAGTKAGAKKADKATAAARPAEVAKSPESVKSPEPVKAGEPAPEQSTSPSVAFVVAASTNKDISGKVETLSLEPFTDPIFVELKDSDIYEFKAPVNLGKAFLGFVQVHYAKDVVFEPYFRTQLKVITFALLFIYISVFVIYMIGRNIVLPILFLRLSVSSISKTLTSMIQGTTRISSDLLQYQDRVLTKDEIKGLSNEVGNMTNVIRGIVPYISASTLKAADRTSPSTESRDLCFLFTDIRGFTTLCEGMTPEKVVEMLNHYLDLQASIIIKNHGDVDKFVGDEVMAMFEGPDKELNACKTGMEIRLAMAREKEIAIAEKRHVVSIGIGINTGPVVFGSVGAKDRMDFTSIGDTVNLAARLEGANKAYGTKTLITEAVYERIKDTYLCREVDLMTVKGKSQAVRIYEVVQTHEKADPKLVKLCEVFEKSLLQYRAQKWDAAAKGFSELRDKLHDDASVTYLNRIELFRASPPPGDWDGVFNMTVK